MDIDCHVKNLRSLGYENLEEWVDYPDNCYCARKNIIIHKSRRFPPTDSYYCNPYKVGKWYFI